jgi:hypothetical protein
MRNRAWGRSVLSALVVWTVAACGTSDPSRSASVEPSSRLVVIALLDPDAVATIPALDAEGAWGTITVRRGEDIGGYPTSAVQPDSFVVEAHVEYVVERDSMAPFGAGDWALVRASDRRPVGGTFEPDLTRNPWEIWGRPALAREATTEQIAIEPRTLDGWLLFEVPRTFADVPLELVYRPAGFDEAVSALAIRDVGPAPEPVPTATPEPRPAALTYDLAPDAEFSTISDDVADRLFVDADSCHNPVAGYTLAFPDDWYSNTAVGTTPACSWFSPTFFEVDGPGVPEEIAIVIRSFEGGIGFVHEPDYTVSDQFTVDGWNANRAEEVGGLGADGWLPRSLFTYQYTIWASEDYLGLKVVAATSNDHPGDYERNKAILDRIVASMRFDR